MVKPILTTQQGNSSVAPLGEASQIPRDRFILRNMFPTTSMFDGKTVFQNEWAQTPFRIAMNAGDLYSRQSEPGGSNQVKGSAGRPNSLILSSGGPQSGNGASGNQHYVYDSSVYTKYKNLAAKNHNYNDTSFGGDQNNASFVNRFGSLRGVRTM
jgi:hypothetical protein